VLVPFFGTTVLVILTDFAVLATLKGAGVVATGADTLAVIAPIVATRAA
jgi:hypothetical protein